MTKRVEARVEELEAEFKKAQLAAIQRDGDCISLARAINELKALLEPEE